MDVFETCEPQLNGRALTLFGTLCSSDAELLCVENCFTANDTDRFFRS